LKPGEGAEAHLEERLLRARGEAARVSESQTVSELASRRAVDMLREERDGHPDGAPVGLVQLRRKPA